MEIKISDYNNEIKNLYSENNEIPVFSDVEYINFVKNEKQELVFLCFYNDNTMIGLMPVVKTSSKLFTHLVLPSLTPFSSIILKNALQNAENTKKCYDSLEEFIKSKKIGNISFSTITAGLFETTFLNKTQRITYQIDLSQDLKEIHAKFRSDKKRNIKKQETDGISISFERNETDLTSLILKTYERQDKKPNWINAISALCKNYKNAYQVTASIDSKPVSTLFFVYDDNVAYYLAGGFDHEVGNYNAGPIVMWEGIKHAKLLGLKTFDFEGSKIENIQKYFESFGADQKLFDSFTYSSKSFLAYNKLRSLV